MSLTQPHRKSFYWIVARLPDMTNSSRSDYIYGLKLQFLDWLRANKKRLVRDGFHVVPVYDERCNGYLGFKMMVQKGNPKIGTTWLFDGEEIEERKDIKIQ